MEEPCIIWWAVRVEAMSASRVTVPDALACALSWPKYAFLRSSCCQAIPIRAQTDAVPRGWRALSVVHWPSVVPPRLLNRPEVWHAFKARWQIRLSSPGLGLASMFGP